MLKKKHCAEIHKLSERRKLYQGPILITEKLLEYKPQSHKDWLRFVYQCQTEKSRPVLQSFHNDRNVDHGTRIAN